MLTKVGYDKGMMPMLMEQSWERYMVLTPIIMKIIFCDITVPPNGVLPKMVAKMAPMTSPIFPLVTYI